MTETRTWIPDVLPGRYRVVVGRYISRPGRGPGSAYEDVTERVRLEVRIGQTTRIELRP